MWALCGLKPGELVEKSVGSGCELRRSQETGSMEGLGSDKLVQNWRVQCPFSECFCMHLYSGLIKGDVMCRLGHMNWILCNL